MPKDDDGFQGWRPWAFGDVWDKMSSKERRFAFWSDWAVALAGVFLMLWLFGCSAHAEPARDRAHREQVSRDFDREVEKTRDRKRRNEDRWEDRYDREHSRTKDFGDDD